MSILTPRDEVIVVLEVVRKEARREYERGDNFKFYGICKAVEQALHGAALEDAVWEEHRNVAFEAWEHYSGDILYPVPATDDIVDSGGTGEAEWQYDIAQAEDRLWLGEQGALRLHLLDHLIEYFKAL